MVFERRVTNVVRKLEELTGRSSIGENGLKILPGCDSLLVSKPEIRALPHLAAAKEESLQALSLALQAVVSGQAFITVAFDIPVAVDLSALSLPALAGADGLAADRPAVECVRDLHPPVPLFGPHTRPAQESGGLRHP